MVPRLSTMRVLIPQRLIQFASMSPAGPAPTMRTSTWVVGRVMILQETYEKIIKTCNIIWTSKSLSTRLYHQLYSSPSVQHPKTISADRLPKCGGRGVSPKIPRQKNKSTYESTPYSVRTDPKFCVGPCRQFNGTERFELTNASPGTPRFGSERYNGC